MLTPERAAEIVESLPTSTPVHSSRGPRKGEHGKYTLRFEFKGSIQKHIAISRRPTGSGVTFYVNAYSTRNQRYSPSLVDGVSVLEFYPKGHQGRTGDKGLSSSAGTLPSLLPLNNDVFRLSTSDEQAFHRLISWYAGAELKEATANEKERTPNERSRADEKTLREILTRRGQPEFREKLLSAYGRTCCITNCGVESLLEAAHIVPHSSGGTYEVTNGLLLRSDVHTLFDLGLLCIDEDLVVRITPDLSDSEYVAFDGAPIRLPSDKSHHPEVNALRRKNAALA